jgi:hypothetical protein
MGIHRCWGSRHHPPLVSTPTSICSPDSTPTMSSYRLITLLALGSNTNLNIAYASSPAMRCGPLLLTWPQVLRMMSLTVESSHACCRSKVVWPHLEMWQYGTSSIPKFTSSNNCLARSR